MKAISYVVIVFQDGSQIKVDTDKLQKLRKMIMEIFEGAKKVDFQ